ncbi:hypothetical protein E6O75_ATG02053 [Venturia nashicola]|uniref:Uncharacterized protein n=1 Tax=Venturia nashicola TaxID=86259 RepID=A0A4Z1P7T4_9PEZI|nr:hypothetical protein E6O75_ATG02053 [Venturia nashicola]
MSAIARHQTTNHNLDRDTNTSHKNITSISPREDSPELATITFSPGNIMAELPETPVHPAQSVGFFHLGATVHHILTRIKSEPSRFPKIQLIYSPSEPLVHQTIVNLPKNGIRLTFDGSEQRLRLIEVLDFQHSRLSYKNATTIFKHEDYPSLTGPPFRHIYQKFGPTTQGEFLPEDGGRGKYCISWPGIAFWFPLQAPPNFAQKDWANTISDLSSNACGAAVSMAIFNGETWPDARKTIFTSDMSADFLRAPVAASRKDGVPAEVERAKVYDRGRIELVRRADTPSFWINLSETTQQDLLTELGPPDSTYKKTSKYTSPHRHHRSSSTATRPSAIDSGSSSNSEADDASAWSDEEDEDPDSAIVHGARKEDLGTWWNYYTHGLDILISTPTRISKRSPTSAESGADDSEDDNSIVAPRNHLTVTKVIIHGNVPGSYQFNRHRRLQWSLESYPSPDHCHTGALTSEMKFRDIQGRLREVFKSVYEDEAEEKAQQEPMAINRDWGEGSSMGGSVEFLEGFEGGGKGMSESVNIGEVLVYGFPGLGFEVLRNGVVSLLQVW